MWDKTLPSIVRAAAGTWGNLFGLHSSWSWECVRLKILFMIWRDNEMKLESAEECKHRIWMRAYPHPLTRSHWSSQIECPECAWFGIQLCAWFGIQVCIIVPITEQPRLMRRTSFVTRPRTQVRSTNRNTIVAETRAGTCGDDQYTMGDVTHWD